MDAAVVPQPVFEELVLDALDTLPPWLDPVIEEIAVLVQEEPAPEDAAPGGELLLGQYRGRPGPRVPGSLPDVILLYRRPILAACTRPEEVPDRVLRVLGHEVGHAMGLPEARLRALGWH